MPKSERNCCVVNCNNTERSCEGSNIKFYSFPGKSYEVERRQKWIRAVNRKDPDGFMWVPTKNLRICSTHFVGGQRSTIQSHPAYIPTIFPVSYSQPDALQNLARSERYMKRRSHHSAEQLVQVCNGEMTAIADSIKMKIVAAQVYFNDEATSESFIFESFIDGQNLSTQCDINILIKHTVTFKEQGCGPEENDVCQGFHGYNSLKKENQLRDLTSANFQTFNYLLELLSFIRLSNKLSQQNVLLLFLMKIKLSISFRALGIFSQLHSSTAVGLFTNLLQILTERTSDSIFWPSRNTIQKCMPPSFKEHYPRTRIIIDCTEIKTDQPSKVDERIFMYSSYKGASTFKFLVGITPNGFISFKSKCYGGRSSDSYITVNSGLLDLLQSGDVVLADKGFPGIKTNLNNDNILVVMPPILHNGKFSEEEILETYSVASVRIHVEHIQRIKIYKILKYVPKNLFKYIDDIVHMCCVLANFLPPLFKNNNTDN